jgi:CheY-like chemotaxis protein
VTPEDTTERDGPANAEPRLLYIEDNAENVRLIEHVFARFGGFAVLSATHGRSGIELARREQPDVILLDVHLPDMTGEEVTAALKQHAGTHAIPIVVLSGAADPAERRRVLEQGARGYLAKPFKLPELISLVERCARPPRHTTS